MSGKGPNPSKGLEVVVQVGTFVLFVWGIIKSLPTAGLLTNVLAVSIGCSIATGISWAVLINLSRSLPLMRVSVTMAGDTGGEPNGKEAFAWALIVFAPVIFAASRMQPPLRDVGWKQYCSLLVGFVVGAVSFYGFQMRRIILNQKWAYIQTESTIALLWSIFLSVPAFLIFEFSKSGVAVDALLRGTLRFACFTLLVWLPISIFVSLVADRKYGQVRGIIAGLTLQFSTLAVTLATGDRTQQWLEQLLGVFGLH